MPPQAKLEPEPQRAPMAVTVIERNGDKLDAEKPVEEKQPVEIAPTALINHGSSDGGRSCNRFIRLRRVVMISEPSSPRVQTRAKQHEDLLVSLMLVLGTPMIANLVSRDPSRQRRMVERARRQNRRELGRLVCAGRGFADRRAVPRKHWSLQRTLSVAGLSWASRALGAGLSVLYAFTWRRCSWREGLRVFRRVHFAARLSALPKAGLFFIGAQYFFVVVDRAFTDRRVDAERSRRKNGARLQR